MTIPHEFRRKRNRLNRNSYLGPQAYFVTICARDRKRLFTNETLVCILLRTMMDQFKSHRFAIHAYCFMSDHCHIVISGQSHTSDLAKAVRAFKGAAVNEGRKSGWRNLRQRGFYDHIVRSGEDLDTIAAYISENPVRACLVRDPHKWPFSGSFVFDWTQCGPAGTYRPLWKESL